MVLTTGSELATGNFMVMTAGLLAGRVSSAALAQNWVLSYVGNLVGCTLAVALTVAAKTATGPALASSTAVATAKARARASPARFLAPRTHAAARCRAAQASLPFMAAFSKACMANWFVVTGAPAPAAPYAIPRALSLSRCCCRGGTAQPCSWRRARSS